MLYADLLSLARPGMPHRGDDMFNATIANMAIELVWDAYDWPESIAEGAPFYLLPGESDYTAPLIHPPVDFRGLRYVQLTDLDSGTSGPLAISPVTARRHLDITGPVGVPELIAWVHDRRGLRVWPRPGPGVTPGRYVIGYTYKRDFTLVSPDNFHIPVPFGDNMISPLVLAVIWASAKLTGSNRASEFFELALREINRKAFEQGLADGDSTIAPTEGLAEGPIGYAP